MAVRSSEGPSRSWVESANAAGCDFPIRNLPYGVFRRAGEALRCGVAIGDFVLDLAALEDAGLINAGAHGPVFRERSINAFMALGPKAWAVVRAQLMSLLAEGGDGRLREDVVLCGGVLFPLAEAELMLPIEVAGYTDFYAGRQHAFNVGSMFRGAENALPPNWLHIPIGYNGRASTVVVSGTDIHRPLGQRKPPDSDMPVFGPSRRLDFELELGSVIGTGGRMGEPVTVGQADEMIFGYVLLNDWSARDIQAWEYQPLGPFQAKAFATSISPWVVTKAALEPFRVSTPQREKPLLPYLRETGPLLYDIDLEVSLRPAGAAQATIVSRTNYRHMYYSAAQQLAHHAVSGCRMDCGDLLGSGTISGPGKGEYGSLLELAWGGKEPITLDTGETRSFLEDGDVVALTGGAQGEGYRIGFGACTGRILPAPPEPDWGS
ncbi:fumarylacetoacetase [Chelativorans sp. AA-79]|uniref:fumarylacetoacetase n=1 Tax=Chelativorans sp. AA-79 TaxID=3028735 RepID=UPI0023F8004C|nr:fumarylacetoacetase [Chelativorans sp. AA-79]WEX10504.1 fumarylacetoacetase [Chelativorans sp. AA-79]